MCSCIWLQNILGIFSLVYVASLEVAEGRGLVLHSSQSFSLLQLRVHVHFPGSRVGLHCTSTSAWRPPGYTGCSTHLLNEWVVPLHRLATRCASTMSPLTTPKSSSWPMACSCVRPFWTPCSGNTAASFWTKPMSGLSTRMCSSGWWKLHRRGERSWGSCLSKWVQPFYFGTRGKGAGGSGGEEHGLPSSLQGLAEHRKPGPNLSPSSMPFLPAGDCDVSHDGCGPVLPVFQRSPRPLPGGPAAPDPDFLHQAAPARLPACRPGLHLPDPPGRQWGADSWKGLFDLEVSLEKKSCWTKLLCKLCSLGEWGISLPCPCFYTFL